jgi:hypothetical protein
MKNKFYWLICLSVFLLLIINCSDDWLLYRTSSDYFPLKTGDEWVYEKNGTITTIETLTDTTAYGLACSHLIRNFGDEYWSKENGDVKKLIFRTVDYGGTDYVLQQSWLLEYRLPFVIGNYWSETFNDTVVILGDTFRLHQTMWRKVVQIADLSVPAGSFYQTYKLEYSETFSLNDSTEEYSGFEWFAPGIGLIKRVINNSDEVLIDYSVK